MRTHERMNIISKKFYLPKRGKVRLIQLFLRTSHSFMRTCNEMIWKRGEIKVRLQNLDFHESGTHVMCVYEKILCVWKQLDISSEKYH